MPSPVSNNDNIVVIINMVVRTQTIDPFLNFILFTPVDLIQNSAVEYINLVRCYLEIIPKSIQIYTLMQNHLR